MADRFTPGPLTPNRCQKTGDVGLLDDHRNVVAECFAAIRDGNERADDEAMANARLFSTAHELLLVLTAVCDQALARRERILAEGGKVHWGEEAGALYERTRDVIAKATAPAPSGVEKQA